MDRIAPLTRTVSSPAIIFGVSTWTSGKTGSRIYAGTIAYGGIIKRERITTGSTSASESEMIASSSINDTPVKSRLFIDDDPELAAMTEAEIIAEAKASFGAWADRDDIDDDWLPNLRAEMNAGWEKRLARLYDSDEEISV